MSYTRDCKTCGQRISLRQMPDGQWVAFDVSTQKIAQMTPTVTVGEISEFKPFLFMSPHRCTYKQ